MKMIELVEVDCVWLMPVLNPKDLNNLTLQKSRVLYYALAPALASAADDILHTHTVIDTMVLLCLKAKDNEHMLSAIFSCYFPMLD